MAPRGRRPRPRLRKMGERRIDAAHDAMRSYGFSEDLIFTTVEELLEVYGKEGWPFIEEGSYGILLEAILEKVEQEAQKGSNVLQENEKGKNKAEELAVVTSNGALLSSCDNMEALAFTSQIKEASDSASQTRNALDTLPLTIESDSNAPHLPAPKLEESSCREKSLDQDCKEKRMNDVKETAYQNSSHIDKLGYISHSSPLSILSQQKVDCLPSHRRRPCYGWISSDDEVDLVELPPAPLPAELEKLLLVSNVPKKRKSRFDVRPEDM